MTAVEGIALLLVLFVGSWMAAVAQMKRAGIGSPVSFMVLAMLMLLVAGPYVLAQLAWWHFSIELLPWTLLGLLPAWAVIAWLRLHQTNRT